MATVDQCNECIRYLNGRQFGADRIGVEFAKSQDDKERDRKERAVRMILYVQLLFLIYL